MVNARMCASQPLAHSYPDPPAPCASGRPGRQDLRRPEQIRNPIVFLITAGPKFVAGGGLGLGPRRGAPEECARAFRGWRILGGNRDVPCGFVADSSPSTFLNKIFLNKISPVIDRAGWPDEGLATSWPDLLFET